MRELLVDGYNVIHAWPQLKRAMHERGLEDARRMLIHVLAEYGARSGVQITVVFDAHGRGDDRGGGEVVDGVTVRYGTRTASADHVIERLANQAARRGDATGVVVATGDRLQRSMVAAMGLPTLSARALLADVERVAADVAAERRPAADAANRDRRIEEQLAPEVLRRLEALRRGRVTDDEGGS